MGCVMTHDTTKAAQRGPARWRLHVVRQAIQIPLHEPRGSEACDESAFFGREAKKGLSLSPHVTRHLLNIF